MHHAVLLSRRMLSLVEIPEELRSKEKLAQAFQRGQLTHRVDSRLIAKLFENEKTLHEKLIASELSVNQQKINQTVFEETSRDIETTLSWIAIREIGRLHKSWRSEKWYAVVSERPLVEPNPRRALLNSLRAGILGGVDRWGARPSAGYWLRIKERQVDRLDISFLRADILRSWPPLGKLRRGPKPFKIQRAIAKLRLHVYENYLSYETLCSMREKELVQICAVQSRDTARKARDAVLSDFFPQTNFDNK